MDTELRKLEVPEDLKNPISGRWVLIIDIVNIYKEVRLRGERRADTRVPPGTYDIHINDVVYSQVLVAEPHINFSPATRVLSITCDLDSFSLDMAIKAVLAKGEAAGLGSRALP